MAAAASTFLQLLRSAMAKASKILHGLLEEGMGPIVESVCRSLP